MRKQVIGGKEKERKGEREMVKQRRREEEEEGGGLYRKNEVRLK